MCEDPWAEKSNPDMGVRSLPSVVLDRNKYPQSGSVHKGTILSWVSEKEACLRNWTD